MCGAVAAIHINLTHCHEYIYNCNFQLYTPIYGTYWFGWPMTHPIQVKTHIFVDAAGFHSRQGGRDTITSADLRRQQQKIATEVSSNVDYYLRAADAPAI